MTGWVAAICAAVVTCLSFSACAQFESPRKLTDEEVQITVEALMRDAAAPLLEDPSCKARLDQPGAMSIAQGLGVALVRAASEKRPVAVLVDCFRRPGYPLATGEEYCRLAFARDLSPKTFGYGLAFVMDWKAKRVRAGSVECY